MCLKVHQKDRVWDSCPYLSHTISWAPFLGCLLLCTLAILFHNCLTLHRRRLLPLWGLPFLPRFIIWQKCFYPLRYHLMQERHVPNSQALSAPSLAAPALPTHSTSSLILPQSITYTSVSSKRLRPIRAILLILYLQWSVVSDIWSMK